MLVGPDAAIRLLKERSTSMVHRFDQFQPAGWPSMQPIADRAHTKECYVEGLGQCAGSLVAKMPSGTHLLHDHDFFVSHSESASDVETAFAEFVKLTAGMLQEKKVDSIAKEMFGEKVEDGLWLTKHVGPTRSASLFLNLYSLLAVKKSAVVDKSILAFAYGAGASALYRFRVDKMPEGMEDFDASAFLSSGISVSPEQMMTLTEVNA